MTLALRLDAIDALPKTPASDLKKLGWRGVMKTVGSQGRLVVTNHNEPEAVILSTQEYAAIIEALALADAAQQSALNDLRRRFDERLSALQSDEAGDRLRGLIKQPTALGGQVKAGSGY